jgi:hypothetical protein
VILPLLSSDATPIVAIAVFAALLIGGLIWSWRQDRKRRNELEAWATSRGFSFDRDRDDGMDVRFEPFSCLRQGSNRYAYDVMWGPSGERQACCFDYHYETYSTDSKGHRETHHHHFSAVVLVTNLPLKPLFIRPEGFFDKITEFFGADDIDFESAQFSREFYVKAPERRWAFDVIHQATMEFLLGEPRYHVQFAGPFVMAWRANRFAVRDFQGALDVAAGILDRLPNYVLQDLKGAGP